MESWDKINAVQRMQDYIVLHTPKFNFGASSQTDAKMAIPIK